MFYRGHRYIHPMQAPFYLMRGMNRGYENDYWEHDHQGGYNPPPPPDGGNNGGFFGGGALTSFIFGGIAGAVLANVFDQKQVNAQAIPYPAQPIPVATPVSNYPTGMPQVNQAQFMNQGMPMQTQVYGSLMNGPNYPTGMPQVNQTQFMNQGMPMQTQAYGSLTNGANYPTGMPQGNQAQYMNQEIPIQTQNYDSLMNEPSVFSTTKVIKNGQLIAEDYSQSPLTNTPYASSVPASGNPMTIAMPYYMFPVQSPQ